MILSRVQSYGFYLLIIINSYQDLIVQECICNVYYCVNIYYYLYLYLLKRSWSTVNGEREKDSNFRINPILQRVLIK